MKLKPSYTALVCTLAAAVAASLSGCGSGDFPVSAGNVTIESEPENVVVLDASAADIIDYIGYSTRFVGRSDEVDQDWLSVVPSVGSSAQPGVDDIAAAEADIVFASEDTDSQIKTELSEKGITVVTIDTAQTQSELETNYRTIGRILGGEVTGAAKANQQYSSLIGDLEKIKASAEEASGGSEAKLCYLYSENGQLKMMTSGTYCDMLLGYTGAINIAVNVTDSSVEVSTLKTANPDYIFYDSDETLQNIKDNDILKNMTAIKKGNVMQLSGTDLTRQGQTAINVLQKIAEFMYPSLATDSESTADTAEKAASSSSDTQQATTAPAATEPTTSSPRSVADHYGIKISESKKLSYEDGTDGGSDSTSKDIKALQQRLYDLGYIDDSENVTGYYGDITKAAVRQFQENSGISQNDYADSKTLSMIFSSNAARAE